MTSGVIQKASMPKATVPIRTKLDLLYAFRQYLGPETTDNRTVVQATEALCSEALRLHGKGIDEDRILPQAFANVSTLSHEESLRPQEGLSDTVNLQATALQAAAQRFRDFSSSIEATQNFAACDDEHLDHPLATL